MGGHAPLPVFLSGACSGRAPLVFTESFRLRCISYCCCYCLAFAKCIIHVMHRTPINGFLGFTPEHNGRDSEVKKETLQQHDQEKKQVKKQGKKAIEGQRCKIVGGREWRSEWMDG
ncbi:hypothetical protein BDV98DRAFT_64537 [Pterulicium gracile]|uniref:Uncharacterized protein n=1 Tax=Pterulicium gracile TaxID=1884261 RepID=A0A5C3QJD6_9AGAR|nr:hypothetical protein BDV98DRAFT_64537 [Pterula gracilis]